MISLLIKSFMMFDAWHIYQNLLVAFPGIQLKDLNNRQVIFHYSEESVLCNSINQILSSLTTRLKNHHLNVIQNSFSMSEMTVTKGIVTMSKNSKSISFHDFEKTIKDLTVVSIFQLYGVCSGPICVWRINVFDG